ncbi:MAG: hypothetical protein RIT81_17680 [Deltaproteobacteria bacterium]
MSTNLIGHDLLDLLETVEDELEDQALDQIRELQRALLAELKDATERTETVAAAAADDPTLRPALDHELAELRRVQREARTVVSRSKVLLDETHQRIERMKETLR